MTIVDALAMLRLAAADGITTLVATPHSHHARDTDIRLAAEQLQRAACADGLPLTILPGSEVRITSGLDRAFRAGELQTINDGPWLLLELPLHDEWPLPLVLGVLERLRNVGARPILAHAERYPFVQRHPAAVTDIVVLDVPIQINAQSLLYRDTDPDRVTAEALLRAGLVHLLASDAHNARYRPPVLSAALACVADLTCQLVPTQMQNLARAIVEGREVEVQVPRQECAADSTHE
ncbi:MAG: hypothetical protein M9890_11205 [Thermomicrobiales bacterium]|nr:hypothetical protein [Thermomicrobiales bacterium]